MANEGSISRLPSGLRAGGSGEPARPPSDYGAPDPGSIASSTAPTIIALIALLLAIGAIYISLNTPQGMSAQERAELKAIAKDLRDIQQKDIIITSQSLRTTVYVEKSFPIREILPDSFSLPVKMSIPVSARLTALSSNGQLVPLTINETINVDVSIPVDAAKASEGVMVSIHKEIPIETRFSTPLRISAVYGQEFNSLISRLDRLGEGPVQTATADPGSK